MMVEVESKEEAMYIIPPMFRHEANIIQLTTFTAKDMVQASDMYHQD